MTDEPENVGEKAAGRGTNGRFIASNTFGKTGRPKGGRNRATVTVETLLDVEAENLTRKAIELAKDGNITALRLCLERILPVRKDRPVVFELPKIETVEDAVKAQAWLIQAVADGDLRPDQAKIISGLLTEYRDSIKLEDLAVRVADIEEGMKG